MSGGYWFQFVRVITIISYHSDINKLPTPTQPATATTNTNNNSNSNPSLILFFCQDISSLVFTMSGRGPLNKNRISRIQIQYFLMLLDNDRLLSRDTMCIHCLVQLHDSCFSYVVVFACWCYTNHAHLRELFSI